MSGDNGGPAFPVSEQVDHNGSVFRSAEDGLSVRDYFAAKALASFVLAMNTNPKFVSAVIDEAQGLDIATEDYVASRSYDWSDAMLKARQS